MRHRIAQTAGIVALLLLSAVTPGQSQEIDVSNVKTFAGEWVGRAILHNTTLPTELSIREDGSYSGHIAHRPVSGVIRIVDGQTRYEGAATRGRLFLYQGKDRKFLRALADSGEILDYQERLPATR
jgi:hypothetical protein